MNSYKNMFVFRKQGGLMFCLLCLFFSSNSQTLPNLVQNSSFENNVTCSTFASNINDALFWYRSTFPGTPDYFNPCNTSSLVIPPLTPLGFQNARTGVSYAGFGLYSGPSLPDAHEYMGGTLLTPLKQNAMYCVTFYTSLAENSRYAVRNLGIYFSNNQIYYPTPIWPPYTLNFIPNIENSNTNTDTINWLKTEGIYIAAGGESYITLGNFRTDVSSTIVQVKPLDSDPAKNYNYYFIDDISVVEIIPAKAYPTKTLTACSNSTLTLGTDSTFEATYQWQPATGLSCTNCPNPIVTVTSPKKYVLTKQQCSATTKDSVYIQIYTPTLTANAGEFKNICQGDSVKLGVNDTTAFTKYSWQPSTGLSCTNCPQPTAFPNSPTTFTLSKKECSFDTKDTVSVFVDPCEVIVPDIFTPNNDNVNDEWKIKLPNGFKLKTAAVYNRWGTLIYAVDDELLNKENSKIRIVRWDGRTTSGLECSEGVYFYVIQYSDKSGVVQKKKGNITLIR